MKRAFLVFCLSLTALGVSAHPSALDPDGLLRVDGKRVFILGLYENAKDDAFAQEAAEAGFNLIRVNPNQEDLDRAAAHGLQAWIPLGGLPVESDAQKKSLRELIEKYKDHPALAVWEAPDEALWNVWWTRLNQDQARRREVEAAIPKFEGTTEQKQQLEILAAAWRRYHGSGRYALAEAVEADIRALVGMAPLTERLSDWREHLEPLYQQLAAGCEALRSVDTRHVLWFNHAPRNSLSDLARFGTLADIVGCDIYPVPFGPFVGHSDLPERNLPSVGRYTRRMIQSAPGKPAWMVLQGFGWDDINESPSRGEPKNRRPTLDEIRFMAYDAIVHGARGLLYWGTFAVEKPSAFWSDLKSVITELHRLQPFLSAPDATGQVTLAVEPSSGSGENGVVLMAKEHEGRWAFFVVNEAPEALAFSIRVPAFLNGKQVSVLDEPETLTVEGGMIHYGLPGLGVSVLAAE
ncbi:MAG: beta-galactosidase [bacterium]